MSSSVVLCSKRDLSLSLLTALLRLLCLQVVTFLVPHLEEFVPSPGGDLGQGFGLKKTLVDDAEFVFSLGLGDLRFLDSGEQFLLQIRHLLNTQNKSWRLPLAPRTLCQVKCIKFDNFIITNFKFN